MTPTSEGRFCAHCQKNVIDFTNWSDTALYNFFSKNTERVCGTFTYEQLNHPINIPYQPHSRLYRITIALGLTLIFSQTPNLLAQNRPPKIEQTPLLKQAKPNNNQLGSLSGIVLDDKKEPLPSAIVEVFQNGVLKGGAATDVDGNYIVRPLEPGIYNILVLYAGYDSISLTSVVVSKDTDTKMDFTMSLSRNRYLSGVTITRHSTGLVDRGIISPPLRPDPQKIKDTIAIPEKILPKRK